MSGHGSRALNENERRSAGRSARSRRTRESESDAAVKAEGDMFSNLPFVQPTHHLLPSGKDHFDAVFFVVALTTVDIAISSFFSLHRPISITTSFPTTRTAESFNAIFDPPTRPRSSDVIYTLSSAVNALESSAMRMKNDKHLKWDVLRQSTSAEDFSNTSHTSENPSLSLERMMEQFRPFNVPPPPVPYAQMEAEQRRAERTKQRRAARSPARTRTFTTTLKLVESTATNGRKTYIATTSPIVEQNPTVVGRKVLPGTQTLWICYRERRQLKVVRRRPSMFAISVKRQRKLKMKKHKYKKLMRRTRNLRRREGRT